ncbi:hypothetical protein QYF36_015482 [Acer negundo]|nr:hypothetical protein QYF36_015482 [Acer negundo]
MQPKTNEDDGKLIATSYNEEKCKEALTRFVLFDEVPFKTVEGKGFKFNDNIRRSAFLIQKTKSPSQLSSSSIRFNDNIRRAAVASGRHQTLPTKLLAIEPHIQNCVKPTFRVSSFTPS